MSWLDLVAPIVGGLGAILLAVAGWIRIRSTDKRRDPIAEIEDIARHIKEASHSAERLATKDELLDLASKNERFERSLVDINARLDRLHLSVKELQLELKYRRDSPNGIRNRN